MTNVPRPGNVSPSAASMASSQSVRATRSSSYDLSGVHLGTGEAAGEDGGDEAEASEWCRHVDQTNVEFSVVKAGA